MCESWGPAINVLKAAFSHCVVHVSTQAPWWGECRQVEGFGHRAKISALDSRLKKEFIKLDFKRQPFHYQKTLCVIYTYTILIKVTIQTNQMSRPPSKGTWSHLPLRRWTSPSNPHPLPAMRANPDSTTQQALNNVKIQREKAFESRIKLLSMFLVLRYFVYWTRLCFAEDIELVNIMNNITLRSAIDRMQKWLPINYFCALIIMCW